VVRVKSKAVSPQLCSAPAERSGDGALGCGGASEAPKAVSRYACHRTTKLLWIGDGASKKWNFRDTAEGLPNRESGVLI
jgi:hypothetical protein